MYKKKKTLLKRFGFPSPTTCSACRRNKWNKCAMTSDNDDNNNKIVTGLGTDFEWPSKL